VGLFTASQATAADIEWADSAGETTWTTSGTANAAPASASWVGDVAPANSVNTDNAIFTSVSNAQPNLTVQTRIRGVEFQMAAGGLAMTGGNNVFSIGAGGINATQQISGINTITNARIGLLGANQTWTYFSTVDTAGTSTFTFDSTVNLGSRNLTIIGQRNSADGNVGIINFDRAISSAVSGTDIPGVLTIASTNANNTVNLNAVNTFTGGLTITGGTLAITADERIADANKLTMNGGNFNVGTFTETLGLLEVGASNGTITFGSGGALVFGASNLETWTGTLSIAGTFVSGSSLRFGTDASGLTSGQLDSISIAGFTDLSLNTDGFVVGVIPEPSSYAALAGLCGLALVSLRRRRRA
jgi:hypothetical protein